MENSAGFCAGGSGTGENSACAGGAGTGWLTASSPSGIICMGAFPIGLGLGGHFALDSSDGSTTDPAFGVVPSVHGAASSARAAAKDGGECAAVCALGGGAGKLAARVGAFMMPPGLPVLAGIGGVNFLGGPSFASCSKFCGTIVLPSGCRLAWRAMTPGGMLESLAKVLAFPRSDPSFGTMIGTTGGALLGSLGLAFSASLGGGGGGGGGA